MRIKDIMSKMNPLNIIEKIKKYRQNKQILLLCETNPQNVFEYVNGGGFGDGHSVDDILKAIDTSKRTKENDIKIDINAILRGFISGKDNSYNNDIYKIVKYAIKNDLKLDINIIKEKKFLLSDREIAEYAYNRGGIDAYEFCKLFKPDKNNIEQFVEKDLRCIEFDIANNPKVYEYVINSLINMIKGEKSRANEDYAKEYDKMILYLDKAKEVIFYKRVKNDGKYYFPESEMYKNIRNFVKRYKKTHSKENINLEDLDTLNKPFKAFYERDGFFDEEFGREIQEIYFDDASILGMHNTRETSIAKMNDDDKFLNQFFEGGLCNLHDEKSVTNNVAIQDDSGYTNNLSIAELLYWQYKNGKYNIVFKFPKNLLNSKDGVIEKREDTGEAFIPPKYILGAYDRENPSAILITNPNFNDGNVISKEGTITK